MTQTCYPTLKAYLKIVLSGKCCNFVKNYFFPCKNSHAHLQYIHNKYAWFQNDPLKTVRGVDYTNSIPYNAKNCLKWLSSNGCNSVKINSSSTKNPHAHLQYVHNRYARFQNDPFKTGRSWLHKLYTIKCDERTDRQTGGQGQILSRALTIVTGHKKRKLALIISNLQLWVNEPSVFEPLKFYCIYNSIAWKLSQVASKYRLFFRYPLFYLYHNETSFIV